MLKELVILKETKSTGKETDIKPNHFYRCMVVDGGYLICGEYVTKRIAETVYENAIDRIVRDFKQLGLLNADNTKLSKTEFKKLASVHKYGKGKHAMRIIAFQCVNEKNDRILYGFYPMTGNLTEVFNECYQMYLDTVFGNTEHIDNDDIQFGNCGIPISYNSLRVW